MNEERKHAPQEEEITLGAKSLAPLIAVFALIILLTIVVINSKAGKNAAETDAADAAKPKTVIELAGGGTVSPREQRPPSSKGDSGGGKNEVPDSAKTLAKVRKLLAGNKLERAEDELKTLLVFDPDNADALTLLGGILYYSGREKEAETVFRRQIKINPQDHLAYNRLGSALAKQKRYKEAIESVATAIGLEPGSGEAQINLAGIYSITNNKTAALEHFRKAAELLGSAILPLSSDSAFDAIRSTPEFQEILSQARRKKLQSTPARTDGGTTSAPDDK